MAGLASVCAPLRVQSGPLETQAPTVYVTDGSRSGVGDKIRRDCFLRQATMGSQQLDLIARVEGVRAAGQVEAYGGCPGWFRMRAGDHNIQNWAVPGDGYPGDLANDLVGRGKRAGQVIRAGHGSGRDHGCGDCIAAGYVGGRDEDLPVSHQAHQYLQEGKDPQTQAKGGTQSACRMEASSNSQLVVCPTGRVTCPGKMKISHGPRLSGDYLIFRVPWLMWSNVAVAITCRSQRTPRPHRCGRSRAP